MNPPAAALLPPPPLPRAAAGAASPADDANATAHTHGPHSASPDGQESARDAPLAATRRSSRMPPAAPVRGNYGNCGTRLLGDDRDA